MDPSFRQTKSEQLLFNAYIKAVHLISQARAPVAQSHRVNKWFNLTTVDVNDHTSLLSTFSFYSRHPRAAAGQLPGLVVKVYTQQTLLERWSIGFLPYASDEVLPRLYKEGIVYFRHLASMIRLLPAQGRHCHVEVSLQTSVEDPVGFDLLSMGRLRMPFGHMAIRVAFRPSVGADLYVLDVSDAMEQALPILADRTKTDTDSTSLSSLEPSRQREGPNRHRPPNLTFISPFKSFKSSISSNRSWDESISTPRDSVYDHDVDAKDTSPLRESCHSWYPPTPPTTTHLPASYDSSGPSTPDTSGSVPQFHSSFEQYRRDRSSILRTTEDTDAVKESPVFRQRPCPPDEDLRTFVSLLDARPTLKLSRRPPRGDGSSPSYLIPSSPHTEW